MATPEPAGDERKSAAARPMVAQMRIGQRIDDHDLMPCCLLALEGDLRMASGPASTSSKATRPTESLVCRCRTRTRLESRIGVSGWSFMLLSCSGTPFTNRWPL